MTRSPKRLAKTFLWAVVGLCCLGLLFLMFANVFVGRGHAKTDAAPGDEDTVRLAAGTTDTLLLKPELVHSLGVRTSRVESTGGHEQLHLSGSTYLDPNRMVRVHSRFAGEVVAIGACGEDAVGDSAQESGSMRPLRLGDQVNRDQLLAVIWSKDVGEKKSDLVKSLSQLYLDEDTLNRLKTLKGTVSDRSILEAQHDYETDLIAVQTIRRTLRSWRLSDEVIDVIEAEAQKIHRNELKPDKKVEKSWAEVEVRAPFAGTVLEKNITVGDIVSTDLDLFKVADLSKVGVMANVYEEDLPALESLHPDDRHWMVNLKAQPDAPGISGSFELIANMIDPNQHTGAVMGWLPNSDGHLKVGQYLTATVNLPSKPNEVEVPDGSLIEAGSRNIIFVAADAKGERVSQRCVAVIRRSDRSVYIRSQPTPEEKNHGCEPLRAGEWVVTSGTIELAGALENALALAPVQEAAQK